MGVDQSFGIVVRALQKVVLKVVDELSEAGSIASEEVCGGQVLLANGGGCDFLIVVTSVGGLSCNEFREGRSDGTSDVLDHVDVVFETF